MEKFRSEPSTTHPYARHFAASLFAAFVLVIGFVHGPIAEAAPAPVYPISGYFIFGSTNDAANLQKLTDMKSVGADTVITFGSTVKPATSASVPADCSISGVNCVTAATSGIKVNRYFTYTDGNTWGAPSLACPRDKTVTSGSTVYTVLVIPTQGTGCTSSNNSYDVFVVTSGTSSISVSVAKAATALGMKYYTGMPAPSKDPTITYVPDLTYESTFTAFTARFIQLQAKVNNVAGLTGFYHHTEMPVGGGTVWNATREIYSMQNLAIKKYMPTRSALISPYMDNRTDYSAHITVDMAREGIRNIAETANGVKLAIAVQDGMGTGKAGSFFSSDAGTQVDPFAASIVGSGTWGDSYLAPNRDYFWAMADGVEGTGAELWGNMEGMAPGTSQNPCDGNYRGQSTKARHDKQLQQMGNSPVKVISYMWDPFYTCRGTWAPMMDQMQAGKMTPVITDSIFYSSGDVLVTGQNLSGGTIQVKWTDRFGRTFDKTVVAADYNANYGKQLGINPRLESVTAKLGSTSLGSGKYVYINVVNGSGVRNDATYSDRG
ncbi:hypothetical protein IRJ34_15735 [Paenarthrobacter sp. GOM3]|uniref:hypothetical protein n=1 Tax=Paenarthrobacter sp. GOM3 TaxID=2782567 RepID=UPI001BAC95AD|nr:hypothetical protein [Paenarthrobacter sp. GOM3]WOH17784.1 hypothetical protein IRJ34_15735 [Paenarthrobacter sp. GOM3]